VKLNFMNKPLVEPGDGRPVYGFWSLFGELYIMSPAALGEQGYPPWRTFAVLLSHELAHVVGFGEAWAQRIEWLVAAHLGIYRQRVAALVKAREQEK